MRFKIAVTYVLALLATALLFDLVMLVGLTTGRWYL